MQQLPRRLHPQPVVGAAEHLQRQYLSAAAHAAAVQGPYYDGLYPLTEHTITDFHALADQLAEVRRTGFAFECEESTRGIRCIAVPLRKDGQVAAALSIAFPLNRYLPDRVERARSALNQARHQIEALMRGVDIQFYSNPTNYRE